MSLTSEQKAFLFQHRLLMVATLSLREDFHKWLGQPKWTAREWHARNR